MIQFYAYRFPHDSEIRTGIRRDFFPFVSGNSFTVWPAKWDIDAPVPYSIVASEKFHISELNSIVRECMKEMKCTLPSPTSRNEYDVHLSEVLDAIHDGRFEKCVVSRSLSVPGSIDVEASFAHLCHQHPEAFVFCFSSPTGSVWLGASPEKLLEADREIVRTISLAGTRPAGSEEEWDEKNLEEQGIVTRYLVECFRKFGLEPTIEDTFTLAAGSVEHICTTIWAPRGDHSDASLLRLAFDMYPTPALGGYPSEKVKEFLRNERRGLYSGCCGPVMSDGTFTLFVNLRSMEIFPEGALIHVGGGITSMSDPDAEWKETESKSRTILDSLILNN